MLIWILMLLSIVLFWVLLPDALGKKKKNLIFLWLSFLVVVFVVGSRSPHMMNSADLVNYYRMYSRAANWTLERLLTHYDTVGSGYLILNKVLSWMFPWPYTMQYVQAAFCTFVMFWYIYRNADNVFFGVMVYICIGPWQFFLTGFRQSIAVCICMIAFECMKKRKLWWDLLAVAITLFATTMHITAWVFLLAFVVRQIKITKKVLIYAVCVTLVLFVFLDDILALGNSIVQKEYTMNYYGNTFGGLVPILVYLGALLLNFFIWTKNKKHLEENGFEIAMLIFALCLYVLRYQVHIMERVSLYFTPVSCIVLSNGITRQEGKSGFSKQVLPVLSVVLFIILFIYRSNAQYGNYHFYWEFLERVIYI